LNILSINWVEKNTFEITNGILHKQSNERTQLLWSICENLSIDNYYNNVFNAMTDGIREINQIKKQQIISIILFEIKRKMIWDSHKL
jgi:hypothetical protein